MLQERNPETTVLPATFPGELAYQTTLKALKRIRDDEWTIGARFASFHGEYRTITTIFRSDVEHQAAHLAEIRASLTT